MAGLVGHDCEDFSKFDGGGVIEILRAQVVLEPPGFLRLSSVLCVHRRRPAIAGGPFSTANRFAFDRRGFHAGM